MIPINFIQGFLKTAKMFLPMVEKKHDIILKNEVRGVGRAYGKIPAYPAKASMEPGRMITDDHQFLTSMQ